MPVAFDEEALIQQIVERYSQAFEDIVKTILDKELKGNWTGYHKAVLKDIIAILEELGVDVDKFASEAIPRLYGDNLKAAAELLGEALSAGGLNEFAQIHRGAIDVALQNLIGNLRDANQYIGRRVDDVFRKVGLEATARKFSQTKTLKEMQQDVIDGLLSKGLTGFKDKAGRRWDMRSYAEMVARTSSREIATQATVNLCAENGHDLVAITSHYPTCEKCALLQGRTYSLTGKTKGWSVLTEDRRPPIHPNCFPGEVVVSGLRASAVSTRWYDGEIVVIRTAGGIELPVTPNHPILTSKGWVGAGLLVEGSDIVRCPDEQRMVLSGNPDEYQVPARIEDVARAFGETSGVSSASVKVAAEDFHGDGEGSDVCVVFSDSLLGDDLNIALTQPVGQESFGGAPVTIPSLPSLSAPLKFVLRSLATAHSFMRGRNQSQSLLGGKPCETRPHGFGPSRGRHNASLSESRMDDHLGDIERSSDMTLGLASEVPLDNIVNVEGQLIASGARDDRRSSAAEHDTGVSEAFFESPLVTAKDIGDILDRFSGLVERDYVGEVERRQFSGHVYNLQTTSGWYVSNSIITHNCRHVLRPIVEAFIDDIEAEKRKSKEPFDADPRSDAEKKAYQELRDQKTIQTTRRKAREVLYNKKTSTEEKVKAARKLEKTYTLNEKRPPGKDAAILKEFRGYIQGNKIEGLITADNCRIPEGKIVGYALDKEHKRGGDHAIAFEKALGYNKDNYQGLIESVKRNLSDYPAKFKGSNEYGDRYEVLMRLEGPNGKKANVLASWIIKKEEDTPRLTSLYVTKRKPK
ncbi:MAG: hypothetical protein M1548_02005 [Actinobacteria bacterium]|nr:hypothetical protein [Actinomycetota bacterium]